MSENFAALFLEALFFSSAQAARSLHSTLLASPPCGRPVPQSWTFRLSSGDYTPSHRYGTRRSHAGFTVWLSDERSVGLTSDCECRLRAA